MEKLTVEQFLTLQQKSLVIDTRAPEIFARCYIKNSINIPGAGGAFCGFAKMVLSTKEPHILIIENEEAALEIEELLKLVGLTDILGYLVWDRNLKIEMDSLELLSVRDLHDLEDVLVIDVRTSSEWSLGHIQSAQHKELSKFKEWIDTLPQTKKIATICGSGFRSSIAASL